MNEQLAPVLDEIRAILKKHDVAGVVIVANATHVDFSMEMQASWNCITVEHDAKKGTFVRVRSKAADYPSKEAQRAELDRSVGTFVTLGDVLDRLRRSVDSLLIALSKHVDFIGKSTELE